jgi:hypothetical protein
VQEGMLVRPRLAVLAAALAGVVALLVFANGGNAASGNICTTPSTTSASCVKESVSPHVMTANGDAVSVTDFFNQAGIGGATATHVVVSATFSPAVTVKRIILLVNGSQVSSNPCTTASASLPVSKTTVSCPAGNIAGGGTVRMIVRFSTGVNTDIAGAAAYGESGNDNCPNQPNCTANDNQGNHDSLTIASGSAAQGSCFDASQFVRGLVTVSGATVNKIVTASVGQADSSQNLPCTPAGAGVDGNQAHHPTTFLTPDVAFVEFMKLPNNGVGTVTIELASVPNGFVLQEFVGDDPTDPQDWVAVPNCVSGLPPTGFDSCIAKKNGKKFTLNVFGSPVDPRYGG